MGIADDDDLRRDIRYLRDRAEIADCLHRYCRGVDRGDFDFAATAYHPDAVDDRGAMSGSPSEYLEWLKPIIEDAGGTSHNVTNMTFDIQGDDAHTEAYVITCVWSRDGTSVMMGGARYISRFARRGGEWKLIHQEAPMDFTFTAPTTALPENALRSLRSPDDRSYARPLTPSPAAQARLDARAG